MTGNDKPTRWLDRQSDGNLVRGFIQQIKLVWRLLRDRRVPIWVKAVPLLSVGYLFFPADLVPDVLVGLGQLDDLAIIALGFKAFLELAPPAVVQEHLRALIASRYEWTVIDGEAERVNDEQP